MVEKSTGLISIWGEAEDSSPHVQAMLQQKHDEGAIRWLRKDRVLSLQCVVFLGAMDVIDGSSVYFY